MTSTTRKLTVTLSANIEVSDYGDEVLAWPVADALRAVVATENFGDGSIPSGARFETDHVLDSGKTARVIVTHSFANEYTDIDDETA